MNDSLTIAIFSFIGTIIGWLSSATLTNWRILQLEKKVDKHNQLVEWRYGAEERIKTCEENITALKCKIQE